MKKNSLDGYKEYSHVENTISHRCHAKGTAGTVVDASTSQSVFESGSWLYMCN